MLELLLLPHQYLAVRITSLLTVRIHSAIAAKGHAWARLWYLFRALDLNGEGKVRTSLNSICQLLGCGRSTLYEWLREGKKVEAFIWYQVRGQKLRVRLGSLNRVCYNLDLVCTVGQPWGVPAVVPLHEVLSLTGLRKIATLATTQKLQQQSRYAAWRSLPAAVRKTTRLPRPEEFFAPGASERTILGRHKRNGASLSPAGENTQASQDTKDLASQRLSDNLPQGSIRFVLAIGPKCIFASKGLPPYGTSQPTVAWERGYSSRTVQRHLSTVEKRQLVQTKAAYSLIQQAIDHDAPSCTPEDDIHWQMRMDRLDGSGTLTEPSGRAGKPHTVKIKPERFFNYAGRDWLYRCNLYNPILKLCTMRRAGLNYKRFVTNLKQTRGGQSVPVLVDLEFSNPDALQADKERHFP